MPNLNLFPTTIEKILFLKNADIFSKSIPESLLHVAPIAKEYSIKKDKASAIAKISLGRPGRAVNLAIDEKTIEGHKKVMSLLAGKLAKRQIIDELVENPENINSFFTEIIAELAKDTVKNYDNLRLITERMTVMSQFNTNRRLQLTSALWNI